MKKFSEDIKDKDSLYYRQAARKEQKRRIRVNKRKEDKAEFLRKMKWLIILGISGVCIYAINQYYFNNRLASKGQITVGIIENIRHERYLANELGGGLVDHYYISYKFKVGKSWIHSITELKSYQYESHLGESPDKGDTIHVRYLPESPEASELIELK